jgi:hypothetical protein
MYNYKVWLTRGNRKSKKLALELELEIEREFI